MDWSELANDEPPKKPPVEGAPLEADPVEKKLSTLGFALIFTAVLCAGSNIVGVFVLSRAIRENLAERRAPANLSPEDRAQWERGRDAAPLCDCACASIISLAYLPMFLGGICLQRGTGGMIAFSGAVLGLLPLSPGVLIAFPVSLWVLWVLSKGEVKAVLHDPASEPPKRASRRRRRQSRPWDHGANDSP